MSELYREFKININSIGAITHALRVFWAQAIVPFVMQDKRVLMIITSDEAKRNNAQNARLWGYIYKQITEQAWVNGRQFPADVWHEMFCRKFWVCDDVILPDGEIVSRRKSSTDMTIAQFAKYMNDVESYAAGELGVVFQ
jgi:hypothetical protein